MHTPLKAFKNKLGIENSTKKHSLVVLGACALRILLDLAGFCRGNRLMFLVFRVSQQTLDQLSGFESPGGSPCENRETALGIGATTAIFTLVHGVLLKSLPVAKPTELYRIGDMESCCVQGGIEGDWSLFSYDMYKMFRDGTPDFVELVAFQAGQDLIGVRRTGTNQFAESERSEYVSGNYFSMFGIAAYVGHMLTPQDDRKGAEPVAVMSYPAWQQKYGQDPSVVGASVSMANHSQWWGLHHLVSLVIGCRTCLRSGFLFLTRSCWTIAPFWISRSRNGLTSSGESSQVPMQETSRPVCR
jgi:MacB-like periplasmic core domain